MKAFFRVLHKSNKSRARVGQIHTPHGIIDTPGFISVGTNGCLKSLDSKDLRDLELPIMFCNTYHLVLQPGLEAVNKAGGLHNFLNYDRPIITDSGGFQVFSLKYGGVSQEIKSQGSKSNKNSVLKITEDGVKFRSYRDGSIVHLSPESSIQAQKILGADIIVAFDELLPYHINQKYQLKALERTHRWEQRSLAEHKNNIKNQAMYSVIHGGIDTKMRKASVDFLSKLDFDGHAIGGSVGKNLQEMSEMLKFTMPLIPEEKPTHLLGIGDLPAISECVKYGLDTFDSSYPTKAARHGVLLTDKGNVKVAKTIYKTELSPADPNCSCFTCQNYSLAYLNHLLKAHELTFYRLATIHNVNYMINFMKNIRSLILQNKI